MIETEIPAGGTGFDYRLAPLPDEGFFYGINWQTAEGKASAGQVPSKGTLYHTPSNKIK